MIYDKKEIRAILNEYSKKDPEDAYHMRSKLQCWRFEKQIRLCAKMIPKNSKVLDIGCGWGHVGAVLSMMRPDLRIVCIDNQKLSIWEKLKKFKLKLERGDALHLRFKNNSFDSVIAFGVMEHVSDDKKFLKEIYRVSKKGAINFIFNLPNKFALNEFGAKLLGIGYHDKMYTKKHIKELFEQVGGFKIIKIGREFLIPAQVNRISKWLNKCFDKHYMFIDKLDDFLISTPLNLFAEAYYVIYRK